MKFKQQMKNFIFFLKPWWQHGRLLLIGLTISAVVFAPIAGFYSTTLAQAVLEKIKVTNSFNAALTIGISYLLISMFFTLLKACFEDFYFRWKKQKIEGYIEKEIYKKVLVIDYKNFDDPNYFDSYKLVTEQYATKSSETITNIFSLLKEIACFFLYGGLIASNGLVLFIIVFACSLFIAYAQVYWSKVSVSRETDMVNERRKADYLRRLFFDKTAVADMRSSNIKKPLFKMFDNSIINCIFIYKKYALKEFIIDILVAVAQLGTTFAVPIYVVYKIATGQMADIGIYATLISSSMALKSTLDALGWWASQVSLGIAYAQKVQVFFNVESKIETTKGIITDNEPFSIKIENVTFGYQKNQPVMKNLNLSINKNEKIAIVGENGVGKSTLSKLLLRLYDVDLGTIYINNQPISSYDIKDIRNKIGVAFQNSNLYALSVEENMNAYFEGDNAKLLKNLKDVGLNLDLKAQLTKEFDKNGIVLSGGNAQKLCLTRLLHSNFGLLILDEPSSALDPIAEYNIAKLIFNNSPTTTIMIAHRLSTIIDADCIYLLDDGEIKEYGTHEQLMAKNGKYKEMFTKQAEGYLKENK